MEALAERLGWKIGRVYEENDTSAYKRKRITLPNGRSVWRVMRPEFRQMLQDYEDGVIDGIIVYDLDRLARQPRDLEDLIDLVDHFKRPVVGVTGSLDLMTDNGKTMARVLVAMANKSSADTARRVSRQKLQRAQEGRNRPTTRAFGWKSDGGTLEPAEAALVRRGILSYTAGGNWSSLTGMFKESGIPPVSGGQWYLTTIRNMLLSPRAAGLVVYRGSMRPADGPEPDEEPAEESATAQEDAKTFKSPRDLALRDGNGAYIRGDWDAIVSIEEWEAFVAEYEHRHEGVEFTPQGTRKYLLSGLLRCSRPKEDGTPCGRAMVGIATKQRRTKLPHTIYKCPGKNLGGCGNSQRDMPWLDKLIEDLLFLHLEKNQPTEESQLPEQQGEHPDAAKLADVQKRLTAMRNGMRDGTVSPESFFAVVPGLETQEKKLIASLGKARRAEAARAQRLKTPEQVRADWKAATIPGRRAILGQYLQAVMVYPNTIKGRGRDHTSIVPVWKPLPQ